MSLLIAGFIGLAAPVNAQGVLEDAQAVGALVTQVCVPNTLDFKTAFAATKAAATEAGLVAMVDDDKVAVFGNLAAAHLVFTREIDAMACALNVPADTGTSAYYKTLVGVMEDGVKATYPTALSVDSKLPSPHEERYQWVFNAAKDRHFAASLTWHAEDGVQLAIGFRQIYE